MLVPKLEKALGMEIYATTSMGISGVIRQEVGDFVVEEILVDKSQASVSGLRETFSDSVLSSTSARNRYLLCVMIKRNWDTFMAVRNIAKELDLRPMQIHIAGIKDAKAITAQYITIENASIEAVQQLHLKDIELSPLGYLRTRLSPYYLYGNRFEIAIKEIRSADKATESKISKTMEQLDTLGGMPNFFGHQRFGTTRPITHLVGEAIVKRDLKKAAMLFLARASLFEHPSSRHARQELGKTHDFKNALVVFPKQLRYERLMLRRLADNPNDFSGAFKRLPIRLLRLFVQAYQSFLFNKFLSERIKNGQSLGTVEVGDHVIGVERSGLPAPAMYKLVTDRNILEIDNAVKEKRMRLAIPLIGFRQSTSKGVQGETEARILQEEGISMQDFKIAGMPEMSSRGDLRAAIVPINDFHVVQAPKKNGDSRRHSIKIVFTLYRGAYATVFLRELMKTKRPVESGF